MESTSCWLKTAPLRSPFWWWPNAYSYTPDSYDVLLLDIYSDRFGQLRQQYELAAQHGFIGPTTPFMPVLPALPMPLLKPGYTQPCAEATAEVLAVACTITAAVTIVAVDWLFGWGFYTWPAIAQCPYIYNDTMQTLSILDLT